MHRLFKTLFLLPWLSACTPTWAPGGGTPDWGTAPRAGLVHDFNWRLSGDRQVAPLQVFDDGRHTWLQFAPGQALPALFVEQGGIERPATYVRQDPYAIVQGKWPSVVMRGGALQARADYLGAPARTTALSPAISPAMSHGVPTGVPHATLPGTHSLTSNIPLPERRAVAQSQADSGAARLYRVGPADENMRRALARWAGLAGWTFQPEHWAVDVDIPLSGSADFSDDFKRSVRALVASTELGERPLQPCFYTNQVLRVVPLSQACDRTAVRPGASI